MKPITDKYPKAMLNIGGRPLLEHTIRHLKSQGITEIAINLFYLPGVIKEYFKDGSKFGVRIRYAVEEKLLGTAGALRNFRQFFNDTFLVIYGDVLSNINLKKMISFHKRHKGLATIGLYRVNNPTECGIVELKPNNRITKFIEKPKPKEVFTDLVNAGIYVLEPQIIKYIPKRGVYDFGKGLFPYLLREGIPLHGYLVREYLIDIGTKEKSKKANEDVRKGRVYRC